MPRRLSTFALLLALAAPAPAEGKKDAGFVSLFNGKDLDGWVVMGKKDGFVVKDGVIRSEGASGAEWLRSEKQYGDFVLRLDWKVSKDGNSGVFIRSADKGAPWETGYEVQISNQPRDDEHCTGALYGYFPVKPRPDEAADKWHTFEITCKGTRIKVVADGVTCVDVDQATNPKAKDKPLKGYVGLQDSHSPKGHYVEFRNVKIKALD